GGRGGDVSTKNASRQDGSCTLPSDQWQNHGFKGKIGNVQLGQDINMTGSNAAPHRNRRACLMNLWRIIR
ncbi:MAG: hypothetical protein ACPIB4_05465, partial [Candidatus Puniceispirillaceae bacterium]